MSTVEKRKCSKCGTKYKVKVRKGKDSRGCPECLEPEQTTKPAAESLALRYAEAAEKPLRGTGLLDLVVDPMDRPWT